MSLKATPVIHVALPLNQSAQTLVQTRLATRGFSAVFLAENELLASLSQIETLLLGRPPRVDWSPATRLKLIHVAGTGVDPMFPALGLSETVEITNARGAHADAVRDHVLMLALALTRDLPRALEQQRRQEWKAYSTPSVAGQRWVVLGYGAIGQRISQAATALGVRVHAIARQARNESLSHASSLQVSTLQSLNNALADADAVVLCLPLTVETRGLFDAQRVALIPSRAVLINVARGGILDESALLERLQQGTLRGAALDVFDHEPLPASAPHWMCPRLIITPHNAGFTPNYLEPVVDDLFAALDAIERGELPPNRVSRLLGY